MAESRPPEEILADVCALVAGLQVPISIVGAQVVLGSGKPAWERLRDDMTGGRTFGWLDPDHTAYVARLRELVSPGHVDMRTDGPLRILVETAVNRALPTEMTSTFDAVVDEVLDALRTAGYAVVRAH